MKTILITGSNGLLGQNLIKFLVKKKAYNIYGVSKSENQLKSKEGYTFIQLDLCNKKEVVSLIHKLRPDFVVHTAAMTNVDQCELNKLKCDEINVDAVNTLVEICRDLTIHLIHISTDFIFDGQKGCYSEDDHPVPINYYGLSKLKSENTILKSKIDHTILRTILVYGQTDQNRSNIVFWVMNNLKASKKINVVTDQLRMPTHVKDLVYACNYIIENKIDGVYNISSNELLSIYDIALIIAKRFKLDQSLINPITTEELFQPAKRPFKTGFDLTKSMGMLKFKPCSFYEDLELLEKQMISRK